jgi:Tfp pilus assembly protein PilX
MLKKIQFLPKTTSILNNEDGVVIIAALMVLVLLTIVGIASTNTSNTEIKIATHELIYQMNFYQAEGATLEAMEAMDGETNPETNPPTYLYKESDIFDKETMPYDSDFWKGTKPEASALPDTHYVVVSEGLVETGGSNSLSAMQDGGVFGYTVYGHCEPANRGATTVEIGYIKKF